MFINSILLEYSSESDYLHSRMPANTLYRINLLIYTFSVNKMPKGTTPK